IRHGVSVSGARAVADYIWRHRAMLRAVAGQRGTADQRGDSTLAAKRVLDAAGGELHDVDGWAVPLDILRSVPAARGAEPGFLGHYLFPARHSADCGFDAAAVFKARRAAHRFGVHGFHAAADLVDVPVCLCGVAMDVRNANGGTLRPQFLDFDEYSVCGDHGGVR